MTTPSDLIEAAARAMRPMAFAIFDRGFTAQNMPEQRAFLNAERSAKEARLHAERALSSTGIPLEQLAQIASGEAWVANDKFTCAWKIGDPSPEEGKR